ncbi:hypothetical protein EII33_08610, partial [Bacteroides heparinolyticus]
NPASRTTNKSVFVHAYIKVINYRIINQRTNVRPIKIEAMPSGKKKKRHKMSTHKRKKRLRKNRHKSKK